MRALNYHRLSSTIMSSLTRALSSLVCKRPRQQSGLAPKVDKYISTLLDSAGDPIDPNCVINVGDGEFLVSTSLDGGVDLPATIVVSFTIPLPKRESMWGGGCFAQPPGGGVLPYMGYIGMCGPKGYCFSAVLVIIRVPSLADSGHKQGIGFVLQP